MVFFLDYFFMVPRLSFESQLTESTMANPIGYPTIERYGEPPNGLSIRPYNGTS